MHSTKKYYSIVNSHRVIGQNFFGAEMVISITICAKAKIIRNNIKKYLNSAGQKKHEDAEFHIKKKKFEY